MTKKGSTFSIVQSELGLLEVLLADTHGNASFLGRPWAAAGYLRIAAKKAEALAELLDAVQDTDHERGEQAKARLVEIEEECVGWLDKVGADNARMAAMSDTALPKPCLRKSGSRR
jgi:hypothetical protein